VEYSTVLRELETTKDLPLLLGDALAALENFESRVGVTSQDDVVELERLAHLGHELHLATLFSSGRLDATVAEAALSGQRLDDSVDVGVATLLDGEPGGAVEDLEKMVVVHEADEGEGGEVEGGLVGRCGPDGGGHGLRRERRGQQGATLAGPARSS